MNVEDAGDDGPSVPKATTADLLVRLDLAMEVLVGLDELNVETRDELCALMDKLERQISDEG